MDVELYGCKIYYYQMQANKVSITFKLSGGYPSKLIPYTNSINYNPPLKLTQK